MSIGRVGMWPVEAPGVLDVHAFVYFDGNALFIQSADPSNPVKGNGQAIATSWQQIEIPCTIEIGRARLVYRTLDDMEPADEDKTTVAQQIPVPPPPRPAPSQFTPNAGAFSNRNQGPDSDATRLQPMGREPDPTVVSPMEAGTPMAGVPKARPAAGMPAWAVKADAPPISQQTTIGAPPAPPPPQNMGYQAFGSVQVAVPPVPTAPNPMGQTLNSPLGMQQQQQQLMMMQQPGMQPMMMQPTMPGTGPMGSGQMMALPPGSPGAETGRVQQPGELKGFARAKAEWNAMPPIRKIIIGTFPGVLLLVYFMLFDDEPQQQARKPRPQPSASASVAATSATSHPSATATATATTTATTTASTVVVAPTATSTSTATAPTTTTSAPPLSKGKRTPEREAIDLVGQGQYVKAADIYDQLAAQHPDQPVFREAARILRARGNGG